MQTGAKLGLWLAAIAATTALTPSLAGAQPAAADQRYIHLFVLRMNRTVTPAQKAEAVTRIGALQGKVAGLLNTSVGLNQSPRSQGFEVGGAMVFSNASTLAAYPDTVEHKRLIEWLGPLIAQAVEADYPAAP